jgi:hypothetical protein
MRVSGLSYHFILTFGSKVYFNNIMSFGLVSYLYLTIVLTVLPSAIAIVLRFVGDLFISTTLAPPVDL